MMKKYLGLALVCAMVLAGEANAFKLQNATGQDYGYLQAGGGASQDPKLATSFTLNFSRNSPDYAASLWTLSVKLGLEALTPDLVINDEFYIVYPDGKTCATGITPPNDSFIANGWLISTTGKWICLIVLDTITRLGKRAPDLPLVLAELINNNTTGSRPILTGGQKNTIARTLYRNYKDCAQNIAKLTEFQTTLTAWYNVVLLSSKQNIYIQEKMFPRLADKILSLQSVALKADEFKLQIKDKTPATYVSITNGSDGRPNGFIETQNLASAAVFGFTTSSQSSYTGGLNVKPGGWYIENTFNLDKTGTPMLWWDIIGAPTNTKIVNGAIKLINGAVLKHKNGTVSYIVVESPI